MAGFADKHVSIVCQLSERSSRSNDCCCGMLTGRLWPGRDSAGIKLLAEFRTFSRVRERLGYSNSMTTSTGRLWP
jgi:hypothetical protein